MTKTDDHVKYDFNDQSFKCIHCGDVYKPALPCPLTMMAAMMKEFVKIHRKCKPNPKQLKLA
jgi:rubredoxin